MKAQGPGAGIGRTGFVVGSMARKPHGMHWSTYTRLENRTLATYAAGLEVWTGELQHLVDVLGKQSR